MSESPRPPAGTDGPALTSGPLPPAQGPLPATHSPQIGPTFLDGAFKVFTNCSVLSLPCSASLPATPCRLCPGPLLYFHGSCTHTHMCTDTHACTCVNTHLHCQLLDSFPSLPVQTPKTQVQTRQMVSSPSETFFAVIHFAVCDSYLGQSHLGLHHSHREQCLSLFVHHVPSPSPAMPASVPSLKELLGLLLAEGQPPTPEQHALAPLYCPARASRHGEVQGSSS